jgi:hypothetical protein
VVALIDAGIGLSAFDGGDCMSDNPPMVGANTSDIALSGEASGGSIGAALERLVANLNRSEHYDDVNLSLHIEQHPDGGSRTCFSYRCFRRR